MKLQCSVIVLNRLLPALSMKCGTKYKNAVLCLAKTGKDQEIKLVLVTQSNRSGFQYQVKGNVEKIFENFLGQGKCTIRLKEPCHDISISSQALLLKRFLSCVKQVLNGTQSPTSGNCNNVEVPSGTLNPRNEKLEIKKKKDYTKMKELTSTLKTLIIYECNLTKFDSRILNLRNLSTLTIMKSNLRELPFEVSCLYLEQLCLSHNDLSGEKWVFLTGKITQSLKYFDITNCQVKYLPPSLSRCHSLRVLKAGNNFFQSIPAQICLLPKLQDLDVSANNMKFIPGTVRRRCLKKFDTLDISGNEKLYSPTEIAKYSLVTSIYKDKHDSLFSLMELSANRVLNSKIKYDENSLPIDLVKILDCAGQCSCGRMVIKSYGLVHYATDSNINLRIVQGGNEVLKMVNFRIPNIGLITYRLHPKYSTSMKIVIKKMKINATTHVIDWNHFFSP